MKKKWTEYFEELLNRPDGIPAEALKADVSTSINMLYEIRSGKKDIWSNYQRKEILGNAKTVEELCLLVPGKILNRIILERLKMALDSKLREHQAGFCQRRSCTDQIATLYNQVYLTFVDFEILDHQTMWKDTAEYQRS